MSGQRVPHWAALRESTWVLGIRILLGVHAVLGRWPFRLCVFPVVFVHWLANGTARRASLQYLERVQTFCGGVGVTPGPRHGLRHFFNFAETLLDKLLAMGGRYPASKVTLQRQAMLEQLGRGGGGVIVTAHMGCLELCRALAPHVPGLRLVALVHTAHAEQFNQLLQRVAPDHPVKLIQVTELGPGTAIQLAEFVADGAFIAIAGDRVPLQGSRHLSMDFLGHRAPFPIGPYVLAATLGCPLFAMGCTRRGNGYGVDFVRLAERVELPRQQRDAALAAHVTGYVRWLEAQVCAAPLDWFNFFPFWDQVSDDASRS